MIEIIDGLELAARTARHQAKICRGSDHGETARVLEAFALTLDHLVSEELTRLSSEVTEPQIESIRCPVCQTDVLVRR